MLDLTNVGSEKGYGFASLLYLSCIECSTLNSIKPSKSRQ